MKPRRVERKRGPLPALQNPGISRFTTLAKQPRMFDRAAGIAAIEPHRQTRTHRTGSLTVAGRRTCRRLRRRADRCLDEPFSGARLRHGCIRSAHDGMAQSRRLFANGPETTNPTTGAPSARRLDHNQRRRCGDAGPAERRHAGAPVDGVGYPDRRRRKIDAGTGTAGHDQPARLSPLASLAAQEPANAIPRSARLRRRGACPTSASIPDTLRFINSKPRGGYQADFPITRLSAYETARVRYLDGCMHVCRIRRWRGHRAT